MHRPLFHVSSLYLHLLYVQCYAEAKLECTTELHVPRSDSQLDDSLSRTSAPVITIKRSSEARAVPTTTTIVLQPSLVQSNIAQRDDRPPTHTQPDYTPHRQTLSSTKPGSVESGKLNVLKSKNGRSNGSSLLVSSKPPPAATSANHKPSGIVREVQNGQRPVSPSEEATHSKSNSRPAVHAVQPADPPIRAGSPPPSGAAPNTVSSASRTDKPKGQSGAEAGRGEQQVNLSPFQAEEAQSHEHQQLESRHSNSDSDKSCGSAGVVACAG